MGLSGIARQETRGSGWGETGLTKQKGTKGKKLNDPLVWRWVFGLAWPDLAWPDGLTAGFELNYPFGDKSTTPAFPRSRGWRMAAHPSGYLAMSRTRDGEEEAERARERTCPLLTVHDGLR